MSSSSSSTVQVVSYTVGKAAASPSFFSFLNQMGLPLTIVAVVIAIVSVAAAASLVGFVIYGLEKFRRVKNNKNRSESG